MCNLYITSYNPEEVEIVSVGRRVLSTEGKHEIREKIKSTFKQIAKNEQILLLAWLKGPSVDIVEVFKDIFITPPEIVECRNLCQPYRKSLLILESVTETIDKNKKVENIVVITTPDNLEGLRVIFTERFSEWSVDII